jgi:bis(5'-nucleosidyl)-tetraphosphatase
LALEVDILGMPIEKSAGAVIFYKDPSFAKASEGTGENFYLLLHYPGASHRASKDFWELPKGHVEKDETLEDTVRREVGEETGLRDIKIIPGFKETIKYFFKWEGKNILKFVTFFIAETKSPQEVKISGEHIGFDWLPFEEALGRLTFANAKNIIEKANKYLNQTPTP